MNRILQTVLVTFQVACCVLAANIRQAPALHPPVKAGRNNDPLNGTVNISVKNTLAIVETRHCIEEWASGETEIGFNFPQAKQILGVTLDNIRNRMQCIRDTTYGVTGNTVWVSNGCRAEITICYEVSPGPIVPRVNDPAFKVEAFPGTASPLPAVSAPAMTEPAVPEMPKPEHACVEEWASGDSNIQFEYPIASEVISVAVDNVGNQAVCLRDTSYGVRNTTVWVNAGCKGKVFICFHLSVARVARMVHDPAQTGILSNLPAMEIAPTEGNVSVVEQVTPAVDLMDVLTTPPPPTTPEPECIDEWSSGYSRITFTLPHATSLTFLEVTNIEYDNTCTEGRDYGITGSTVWVDLGCKAEFEICFSLS